MDFLLIAVLTLQEGYQNAKAGYQSSVMEHFETMDQCVRAGRELLEAYQAASFKGTFGKGNIRCIGLKTTEKKIITSYDE